MKREKERCYALTRKGTTLRPQHDSPDPMQQFIFCLRRAPTTRTQIKEKLQKSIRYLQQQTMALEEAGERERADRFCDTVFIHGELLRKLDIHLAHAVALGLADVVRPDLYKA